MSIIRNSWADGGQVGPGNYGTITIAGAHKLCYVRVAGAIVLGTSDVTDADNGHSSVLIGVQGVPSGNTPLTLPSDLGNSAFLVAVARTPSEIAVAWAPNTDTAAFVGGGAAALEWSGQLVQTGAIDYYFTTGRFASFTDTWQAFGTMEIGYT